MIVTTTSTAAVANHFSCSRSSPDDRTNLVISAAPATTVAAGHSTTSAECRPGYHPWLCGANGSRHTRLARATKPMVSSAYTAATNQAAGRQRRDGSSPAGNRSSTNAKAPAGTIQIQFTNHSAARAPGIGPGRAAISPYHPYSWLKKPSPSSRPAASKIQPILFAGRRDPSTKPTTGTATNVSSSKTSGKFQRPAVTTCRPRYASGSPPKSSAIDSTATPPVTQRRVRGVIRASSAIAPPVCLQPDRRHRMSAAVWPAWPSAGKEDTLTERRVPAGLRGSRRGRRPWTGAAACARSTRTRRRPDRESRWVASTGC